jgi:hypothetical protein
MNYLQGEIVSKGGAMDDRQEARYGTEGFTNDGQGSTYSGTPNDGTVSDGQGNGSTNNGAMNQSLGVMSEAEAQGKCLLHVLYLELLRLHSRCQDDEPTK